jgi:metal-dependent HD superfamily phosphatase/phosphodiesterase
MITFEQIKNNETIKTYIRKADASLKELGYTEHSFAHVCMVAESARYILQTLDYPQRTIELAQIAGYLHDIGNMINRVDHAQSGALLAFRLLDKMGMEAEDIATIVTAIGNHDESTAFPVNAVAAALILADKSDVRDSRVRTKSRSAENLASDIHDRVNYAVKQTRLSQDTPGLIDLEITIDTEICSLIDYFQIFLERMNLCRQAAEKLGQRFGLVINGQRML